MANGNEAQEVTVGEPSMYPDFGIHREKTELKKCEAFRHIIEQPQFMSQIPAILAGLKPNGLPDPVNIDWFCESIFREYKELVGTHVHLLNTSDSARLLIDGNQANGYHPKNILVKDREAIVYCPTVVGNSRWILVVLKSNGKKILCYDPSRNPCTKPVDIYKRVLGDGWTAEHPTFHNRHKQPSQILCDSAIYTCMYVAYLLRGHCFDFMQGDMSLLRNWVAYCIYGVSIARVVISPQANKPYVTHKLGRTMKLEAHSQSRPLVQARKIDEKALAKIIPGIRPHSCHASPVTASQRAFSRYAWSKPLETGTQTSSHWYTATSSAKPFCSDNLKSNLAYTCITDRPGSHVSDTEKAILLSNQIQHKVRNFRIDSR